MPNCTRRRQYFLAQQGSKRLINRWPDHISENSLRIGRFAAILHCAHVDTSHMSVRGLVRLEIEAQERALEQLEKSTQEATRRAHDAEQRAKSAQETLKASLSFLCLMSGFTA